MVKLQYLLTQRYQIHTYMANLHVHTVCGHMASCMWIPGILDVNTLPCTHKCVALCKCVHGLMNLDTLPDACRWLHMQMDTRPRAFQKKSHGSATLNFLFIQLTVFCHCKVSDRNLLQVLALLSLNLSVSYWVFPSVQPVQEYHTMCISRVVYF